MVSVITVIKIIGDKDLSKNKNRRKAKVELYVQQKFVKFSFYRSMYFCSKT